MEKLRSQYRVPGTSDYDIMWEFIMSLPGGTSQK
jgi:hypothetical protein